MGKKEKKPLRVVLDTNILISTLLFRGELSEIVGLWKSGRVLPVISKETFRELRDILEYPKFRLTKDEIRMIIEEEVLPFFEVVDVHDRMIGVCSDPDDDKFLSCALAASVDFIVSGDRHLCSIGAYKTLRIITASEFLKLFG